MSRGLRLFIVIDCIIAGVLLFLALIPPDDPFKALPVMRASVGFWKLHETLIISIALFALALIAVGFGSYRAVYANSENEDRRDTDDWIRATQQDIGG